MPTFVTHHALRLHWDEFAGYYCYPGLKHVTKEKEVLHICMFTLMTCTASNWTDLEKNLHLSGQRSSTQRHYLIMLTPYLMLSSFKNYWTLVGKYYPTRRIPPTLHLLPPFFAHYRTPPLVKPQMRSIGKRHYKTFLTKPELFYRRGINFVADRWQRDHRSYILSHRCLVFVFFAFLFSLQKQVELLHAPSSI